MVLLLRRRWRRSCPLELAIGTSIAIPLDKPIATCCLHCSHVSTNCKISPPIPARCVRQCCGFAHRSASCACAGKLRAVTRRAECRSGAASIRRAKRSSTRSRRRTRCAVCRRRSPRRHAAARCSWSSSPSRTRPRRAIASRSPSASASVAVVRQEIGALADRSDDLPARASAVARAHRRRPRATRRRAPGAAGRSSPRRRSRSPCARAGLQVEDARQQHAGVADETPARLEQQRSRRPRTASATIARVRRRASTGDSSR